MGSPRRMVLKLTYPWALEVPKTIYITTNKFFAKGSNIRLMIAFFNIYIQV